jgi:hypothetical protein
MVLKKYTLSLVMLFVYTMTVYTEDNTPTQSPTRTVHITQCKKIEFGLTLDQTNASLEEREVAFKLISDFCNKEVSALSEQFEKQAPRITISLVLLNIEEDSASNNDNATDNTNNPSHLDSVDNNDIADDLIESMSDNTESNTF